MSDRGLCARRLSAARKTALKRKGWTDRACSVTETLPGQFVVETYEGEIAWQGPAHCKECVRVEAINHKGDGMKARPEARGGSNSVRARHTRGPWVARATETRRIEVVPIPAARRQKRTIAYVQLGPHQHYDAALIAEAPALLTLAQRYASECGECAGVGVTIENRDCKDCRDIREVIARATQVS